MQRGDNRHQHLRQARASVGDIVERDDGRVGAITKSGPQTRQAIRAELYGADQCHAEGHRVRAAAPTLTMCRQLIAAGFDPGRPLHAYRGDTLCLKVCSLAEGAKWTVKERPLGPALERWTPFPAPPVAPPVRKTRRRV